MAKRKRVTKKKVQRRAARSKKRSGSKFMRGAAGRDRVDSEIKAQKERQERSLAMRDDGPFRLYLKPDTTEREVVILDEEPEFFRYEHQIYNGGRRDLPMYTYTNCVKEWETCPACETIKESYYGLFLSVLDLEPYKTKAGAEVEFSRKLMLVKPQQQKKFIRRWKKEGTLRGQILLLSRDNDKDPVIGNDIEFEGWMDEADLDGQYINEWTDRKKKKHSEDCTVPYDYEKIFGEPDAEQIATKLEGTAEATPGSSKQHKEELDDDDWDEEEEDEKPWDEDEEDEEEEETRSRKKKKKSKTKKKKKRPTRRSRDEEEDEEEDEDPDDEEDEELEEEEDEDEEEEDEEERPRRRAKKRGKKKRRATGRR